MTRRRLLLVHAFLALALGGHLLELARDGEHWPWSSYPMFSRAQGPVRARWRYRRLVLVGQTVDGEELLLDEHRYLRPLGRSSYLFSQAMARPDAPRRLPLMMSDILRRYARRRRAADHHGPRLRGLRLYRYTWSVDPWPDRIARPSTRALLFEVSSEAEDS